MAILINIANKIKKIKIMFCVLFVLDIFAGCIVATFIGLLKGIIAVTFFLLRT
jgi:hypothetical protein